jgi:disulfide bond formation protein DsbB
MTRTTTYTLLALAVLFLAVVPVGVAVFILGFIYGDSPCVMCWEQRIGMALIALIGLFVLRYGARPRYTGLAVLVGAWGVHMGVRHSSLHLARDVGQGFSLEIMGAHTYTWAAFIFWVCVVMMGLLLLFLKDDEAAPARRELRPLDTLALFAFLVVIAGNIVQAFASTGPPPYMGQGDPIRFSFNPTHWVWSLEEWNPDTPVSWRGRWSVDKPSLEGVPADPSTGPLTNLPVLTVVRRQPLGLPLKGTVTDLAYDAGSNRFLLTTQHGVYITDGNLGQVVRGTVVDPGFSVDLATFAGAAFLDSTTVIAVAENKSFVVLKETGKADPDLNFRFFLESADRFEDVTRSRFTTVRAKMMYVMSAAFDPASNSVYTVTLPNPKNRRLVVSRFDRTDMTLSAEFAVKLSADSGLRLGEKRAIEEYMVTGATVADGTLYGISAAHSTLLAIDLGRHVVTAAYAIKGLERPTGLALKGSQFYIAAEGGTVMVIDRPAGVPADR